MQVRKYGWLGILLLLVSTACEHDPVIIPDCPTDTRSRYLFLGHTYAGRDRVDPKIEALDLGHFSQVWLGGDVCSETTESRSTLEYLDKLFGLDRPGTLWTLGNHDVRNGNQQWITEFTGRPTFYAQGHKGFTSLVLNMNLGNDCVQIDAQFDLIEQVCDTIKESPYLIVLTHQAVWDSISTDVDVGAFANTNFAHWKARCSPKGRFRSSVYPLLEKVQQRGIQVFVVCGDGGQKPQKTGAYRSAEGIQFLVSGLNNANLSEADAKQAPADHVLIFNHDLQQNSLKWEFVELDVLLEQQVCK